MARGRKTGGRKLGTPNKATIEKSLIGERAVAEAKAAGRRLAKEVLSDVMNIFAEFAESFREQGELDSFMVWAVRAVECAKALAPFESPRFSAVTVGAPLVTKIEIVGGMSDKLAAPVERNVELAPGTIITADEIEDKTAA